MMDYKTATGAEAPVANSHAQSVDDYFFTNLLKFMAPV